jgi:hypothetical protein
MFIGPLLLLVALCVVPGLIAGAAIGCLRDRPVVGLFTGGASGTVGGIIGLMIYKAYESTLPFEIRRQEWGPYRHIINPPPGYVIWVSIIGGSLIAAIVCAAILVRERKD